MNSMADVERPAHTSGRHVPGPSPDRGLVATPAREIHGGGLRVFLTQSWSADPWLTGTGLVLLALVVPSALGVWLDPRIITGAPAWLKPTKFALSTAIYSLTLAWVFSFLPTWPRMRRIVGRTTALVMLAEIAIIDLQAWRGTTSHFNVATPLDAVLFSTMGIAILAQTLASVAVAVALWKQAFADRAFGWALRLGMTLTIVGAMMGGMMPGPTRAQLAQAEATGRLTLAGAHTVGAPDGGPGLPVTGWSRQHGDLRVPHFVGLHAIQVLPLLTLLVLRRRDDRTRVRLALMAGAAYSLTFALLLIQALAGRPLIPIG
jgi:hypothetical protein